MLLTSVAVGLHLFLVQDSPKGPDTIRELDATLVSNISVSFFFAPVKCDGRGNVYFQHAEQLDDPGRNPLLRISSDGRQVLRVALTSIPGLEQMRLVDFAPASSGVLVLLSSSDGNSYFLAELDEKGALWRKSTLPAKLLPAQVAAFDNGNVLIAGRRTREEGQPSTIPQSFAAIFDRAGRLLFDVSLSEDPVSQPAAPDAQANVRRSVERILALSVAETTDTGYVYLGRHNPPGPVFLVASSGQVVATLRPEPPPGALLSSFKIAGTRLAALYVRPKEPSKPEIQEVILSLWDTTNREKLAEYHHTSARIGSALACFNADVFTFLSSDDDNHLLLIHASGQR